MTKKRVNPDTVRGTGKDEALEMNIQYSNLPLPTEVLGAHIDSFISLYRPKEVDIQEGIIRYPVEQYVSGDQKEFEKIQQELQQALPENIKDNHKWKIRDEGLLKESSILNVNKDDPDQCLDYVNAGLQLTYAVMIEDLWDYGKQSCDNLIHDVLKIYQASQTSKKEQAVVKFIKTWGPLWFCQNPKHPPMHALYRPWGTKRSNREHLDLIFPERLDQSCIWKGEERLNLFTGLATDVYGILAIGYWLIKGEPAPPSYVDVLSEGLIGRGNSFSLSKKCDPDYQRKLVSYYIEKYLSIESDQNFIFLWDSSDVRPTLKIDAGWGFIWVLWQNVAQIISGAQNIYFCDSCHNLYIREGRKPRRGQKQYCNVCRESGAANTCSKKKRI